MRDLLELMRRLRDPDHGCPWDRAQTFASIAPYTLEEAYEVADAIARDDMADLKDELGDLLFQVVFHAQMAEERGQFSFADVVGAILDKMVRRHPHVFAAAEESPGESSGGSCDRGGPAGRPSWEAMKVGERRQRGGAAAGVLDDVPLALPATTRAAKLQRRAAAVGFDWAAPGEVFAKLCEETGELGAELQRAPSSARAAEELGDVLFTCVNLARHQGVDPEAVLRSANAKFEQRFRRMECYAREERGGLEAYSTAELEALWQRSKEPDL